MLSLPDLTSPRWRIAITGGIASGKSYICSRLEAAGHRVFNCDKEAKHIIRHDPEVRSALTRLVGPTLYDADGRLVKPVLAAYLCQGSAQAHRVDAIVHPRVAQAFRDHCHALPSLPIEPDGLAARQRLLRLIQAAPQLPALVTADCLAALPPGHTVFMECALLYEAGFDALTHLAAVVHVSPEVQLRRLISRDHISPEKAAGWIALQLSENERLQRAALRIDNDADLDF